MSKLKAVSFKFDLTMCIGPKNFNRFCDKIGEYTEYVTIFLKIPIQYIKSRKAGLGKAKEA